MVRCLELTISNYLNLNLLLFAGGYDRGECLRTVELYDPLNNRWSQLPSMREARGRFDITVIEGDKIKTLLQYRQSLIIYFYNS